MIHFIATLVCTSALAASVEPVVTADPAVVSAAVKKIRAGQAEYARVADATGLDWRLVGALHYRESGCRFGCRIQDGRRLAPKTDWTQQASSFLRKWMHDSRRTGADALLFAEAYNGFGYRRRGIKSPYVWSGTSYYVSGKFVRDGVFDKDAVDAQLGIYVLLKALKEQAGNGGGAKEGKDEDHDVKKVSCLTSHSHA